MEVGLPPCDLPPGGQGTDQGGGNGVAPISGHDLAGREGGWVAQDGGALRRVERGSGVGQDCAVVVGGQVLHMGGTIGPVAGGGVT